MRQVRRRGEKKERGSEKIRGRVKSLDGERKEEKMMQNQNLHNNMKFIFSLLYTSMTNFIHYKAFICICNPISSVSTQCNTSCLPLRSCILWFWH